MSEDAEVDPEAVEGEMTDDGADGRPPHRIDSRPLSELEHDDVYGALQFCADRLVQIHGDRENDWHVQFLRQLAEHELSPRIVTIHLPQAADVAGRLMMAVGEIIPDAVTDNRGPQDVVLRPKE